MTEQQRLATSLLALRLGIFLVMLVWTIDKFLNPSHGAAVFEHFYGLHGLGAVVVGLIGGAELLLIIAFLVGLWKRFTYGAVFALHAASTLSSFKQYLDPWSNLLFFAAWPMLAACFALYLLRDKDVLLSIRSRDG